MKIFLLVSLILLSVIGLTGCEPVLSFNLKETESSTAEEVSSGDSAAPSTDPSSSPSPDSSPSPSVAEVCTTPAVSAGLLFQLDTAALIHSGTAENDVVQTWSSCDGQFNFSVGAPANAPILTHPYRFYSQDQAASGNSSEKFYGVTFDSASSQRLVAADAATNLSAGATLFLVAKQSYGLPMMPLHTWLDKGDSNGILVDTQYVSGGANALNFIKFYDGNAFQGNTGTVNITDWTHAYTYFSGGNLVLRTVAIKPSSSTVQMVTGDSSKNILNQINGGVATDTKTTSNNETSIANLEPWVIGANGASGATSFSSYFKGTFAEILVYNRPLTAAEISSVESGLATKWGIDLPTHP